MTKQFPLRFPAARWTIFLTLTVIYILVFFHRMAPGVLADDLMASFGVTGAELGSIAASYFIVYVLMQVPAGVLADRLGQRITITAGNIVAGAGSILFALAPTYEIAWAGRFFVGLGVSVVFINFLKTNANWFSDRKFAFMSGLTIFAGNMGSLLSASPLAAALEHYSWRGIFVAAGLFSLLLAGVAALVIRNRPEDAGFPPVNPPHPDASAARGHWLRDVRHVLGIRAVWTEFWVGFGSTGSLYAFMGLWGVPFLRDTRGLPRDAAAMYIMAMMVGYSFGMLCLGWCSDHLGKRRPVLLGTSFLYLLTWSAVLFLPWTPGPAGLGLFALLGFTGTASVVSIVVAKDIAPAALSGTATSLANAGVYAGTAIMQPLIGWGLDLFWNGGMAGSARMYSAGNYRMAFVPILLAAVMALVCSFITRETGRGRPARDAAGLK